jgi:hypothetical protein
VRERGSDGGRCEDGRSGAGGAVVIIIVTITFLVEAEVTGAATAVARVGVLDVVGVPARAPDGKTLAAGGGAPPPLGVGRRGGRGGLARATQEGEPLAAGGGARLFFLDTGKGRIRRQGG